MTRSVLIVHALAGMRGPARTVGLLAANLSKTWDVSLAAPDGFLTSTVGASADIHIEHLPLRHSRMISWMGGSRRIYGYVANGGRPSLIHANGLSALNLAAPAALRFGLPVLVHFHGSENGARARVLARLWIRLGMHVIICPVSEQSREVLRRAGLVGRVDGPILPNPTVVQAWQSHRRPKRGALRVGFVGAPSPRKGLHLLVDIASSLPRDAATWLIFGIDSGNRSRYVERCKERLSSANLTDRVKWMGNVTDPGEAYRQMDILLVPSLQESWCRVAMEGMATGLPVVGTAIPGMSEIFRLVPGSLTFPVDRPEVGREHILRLAGDPELREAIGGQGRSAMRAFDVRVVCNQLEQLYEGLLKRQLSKVRETS